MKTPIAFGLIALSVTFLSVTPVFAQEGGIEVFAGATLFEGGTRGDSGFIRYHRWT